MNKDVYAVSEAAGCLVIYGAAVFLHYVYALSGGNALGLLFGAVNESVWEHVKIFSAAYLGYALLQLLWIKVPFRRYVVAKCVGLYGLMGAIIGFYYFSVSLWGEVHFCVHLLSSAITVALAQLVSYRLTTGRRPIEAFYAPALMLILLYYIMFFSFTIFPPRAELFRDPISGAYGVG